MPGASITTLGPMATPSRAYHFATAATYRGSLRGLHRVLDASLDRWELYVNAGSFPDLTGSPDETLSSTLGS
jgi:hypothetical protein